MFMKKSVLVVVAILVCFITSCDTDRDDIKLSQAELIEFNKMIKNGNWTISAFTDNGNSRTKNYEGFNFTFKESNELLVNADAGLVNGTWRTNNDSGPGYESRKKVYLHIFFGDDEKLSNLTNSFIVISASPEKVQLESLDDDSTSLVFSKN
jgi:hypothetical protein